MSESRHLCRNGYLLDADGEETDVPCRKCWEAALEQKQERQRWDLRNKKVGK